MRKLLVICTFAVCMFAGAANAAELKIGIFNLNKVASDSMAFKEIKAEAEKKFSGEDAALQKQAADFEKEYKNFQLQQQALSAEAREDRQIELSRRKRDLDDKYNNFARKVSAAEKQMNDELVRIIMYSVNKIAEKDKYTLVMEQEGAGAIFVGPALDINKVVLEEVNKNWKNKPKELFPAGK